MIVFDGELGEQVFLLLTGHALLGLIFELRGLVGILHGFAEATFLLPALRLHGSLGRRIFFALDGVHVSRITLDDHTINLAGGLRLVESHVMLRKAVHILRVFGVAFTDRL